MSRLRFAVDELKATPSGAMDHHDRNLILIFVLFYVLGFTVIIVTYHGRYCIGRRVVYPELIVDATSLTSMNSQPSLR